jgi:shikimate kinase
VLEAQARDGVGQLDVDAQVVAVELELVARAPRRHRPRPRHEPRDAARRGPGRHEIGRARPIAHASRCSGFAAPASRPSASAVATAVGARFVEVDQHIEAAAGLSLAEIFELHGEAYYRRLEQDALRQLLAERDGARLVIATGGSIVTDPTNFTWLRERCTTVWLRASTVDHWNRVVDQGDQRPMAENPHAFAELEALMATRTPLYAQADHVVDTAREGLPGAIAAVRALL